MVGTIHFKMNSETSVNAVGILSVVNTFAVNSCTVRVKVLKENKVTAENYSEPPTFEPSSCEVAKV